MAKRPSHSAKQRSHRERRQNALGEVRSRIDFDGPPSAEAATQQKRDQSQVDLEGQVDQDRVAQQIQLGIDSLRGGRLTDAVEYLLAAITQDDRHPLAYNCLGIAYRGRGENAAAIAAYERAIQLKPDYAEAYNNLGIAYESVGDNLQAIACYESSLKTNPGFVAAHNNLGNSLTKAGRLEEAIASFDAALELQPEFPEAINNRGLAQKELGQEYEAEVSFRKALSIRPDFAEAYLNLGNVLRDVGSIAAAHECFVEAVSVNPRFLAAQVRLGNSHFEQGNLEAATQSFAAALSIEANYPQAWLGMGTVQQQLGLVDESVVSFRRACDAEPEYIDALNHLGNALARQAKIDDAIDVLRKVAQLEPDQVTVHNNLGNLYRMQDRVEDAAASYSEVLRKSPADRLHALRFSTLCPAVFESGEQMEDYYDRTLAEWTSLRGAAGYSDLPDLLAAANEPPYNLQFSSHNIRAFKQAYADVFCYRGPTHELETRETQIRIGFVVTSHHEIAFLRLIWDALHRMDNEEFHLTILCTADAAKKFQATVNDTRVAVMPLPSRPDQITTAVREACFDILYYFEIGTDCLNYFLPFFRLAPVQCTSWGIQVTSGIPNIDCYLSSQLFEPKDAERHYTEELICAPSLLAYQTPVQLPDSPKSRHSFGFTDDQTIYLSAQHLGKFHPDFDATLGDILRRDPRGVIVIIKDSHGYGARRLQDRLERQIPDVSNRIVFVPKQTVPDYLCLVAAADVLLDAPYFSGVNTTYDALALDRPIVCLPSDLHRGRYTFGCYRKMDFMDCVADSREQYVEIALSLGRHPDRRQEARDQIREKKSRLFFDDAAVRDHEQIFRTLVAEARSR